MCIRDRLNTYSRLAALQDWAGLIAAVRKHVSIAWAAGCLIAAALYLLAVPCLLYTSDAADERSSVDLGGRRIINKKKIEKKKKDI